MDKSTAEKPDPIDQDQQNPFIEPETNQNVESTEAEAVEVCSNDTHPLASQFVLPDYCVAFCHSDGEDREPFVGIQKGLGRATNGRYKVGTTEYSVYGLADPEDLTILKYITPSGLKLLGPGSALPLPAETHPAYCQLKSDISSIVTIETKDIAKAATELGLPWPPPKADPIMRGVPLLKHSLQGKAGEMELMAKASRPLLGQVCLSGQATVWYAPPNSGKTLIGLALCADAIRSGRIMGGNVYYVNADDNSKGISEKLRFTDDLGAHMLVPGFEGFTVNSLRILLLDMAQSNKARGVIVIIDTIKKFASLMDKRDISSFADACRQFVMHGGTILAFAHTNKNPTPNGALKYAGTTDLIEDFDAAYIISPLELDQPSAETVVRFDCIKRRGDSPEKAAYVYSTENGLTYEQLLASVEEATFDKLGEIERDIEERTDAQIVEAVKTSIREGINTKMHMAAVVAKRTKTSGKSVIRLIDRYTGEDPADHHWFFTIKDRGKHVFELLPPPLDDSEGAPVE